MLEQLRRTYLLHDVSCRGNIYTVYQHHFSTLIHYLCNKCLVFMVKMGEYNVLKVIKEKSMGVFLDDGDIGILLPKRFVPPGTQIGDEVRVFLYHDGEDRPIATTQRPLGVLGDIVKLSCVSTTTHGAFLDWGLMKD